MGDRLGWLSDFVSAKRQEVQGFFATYSESLNTLQQNFSAFKDKMQAETADEVAHG